MIESKVITFKLKHGMDSVPVQAEPYQTLLVRAFHALHEYRVTDLVECAEMPVAVRDDLAMRNMLERPHLCKSSQFHDTTMETFISFRVRVTYD